jgi:quinol-cytochrome oxidoreductase complex cytochrome b subunit
MLRNTEKSDQQEPYYPYFVVKELFLVLIIFIVVAFFLATFFPVRLEDPADPADSLYVPRPAWYFLWLYQLLKYFSGAFAGILNTVIPLVFLLIIFFLPLMDRNPAKAPSQRILAMAFMGITVLGLIVLSVLGFRH